MSSPTRENLLGYVLGALEPAQCEQLEQELAVNPLLREELARLEWCVGRLGLADEPEWFDPPSGLAERTAEYVALEAGTAVMPARSGLSPAMQADAAYLDEARRFTWVDLLTAAAVLVAGFALFFPALSHSRFQADIALCQNRMRQIGLALHEFASLDRNRQFPPVLAEGNRGVAGIYAPTLVDHGLVNDSRMFVCAASPLGSQLNHPQLPTLAEIDSASGETLARYHRTIGGSYGYTMGYDEDGRLVPVTDARRPNFPLLADAPSDGRPGRTTANHEGRGQNFLYEDGRVDWLKTIPCPQLRDDPFHNRHGEVAAGLDADDAVLGASADRPLRVRLIKE